VYTPRVRLIHWQSSLRRPGGLVWKRKAHEAISSAGARDGMTMLVVSVLCWLLAGDMWSGNCDLDCHEKGQMP
jgi:hypothetical protein